MPKTTTNRLSQWAPGALTEVDNLFDHFFRPAVTALTGCRAPASLWEEEGHWRLEVDAPGVPRDGVELTFEKKTLTVTLDRPAPEGRSYAVNERSFGKQTRTVTLPNTVDPESIEAELTDGVLRVSIAKKPETLPRKIELK